MIDVRVHWLEFDADAPVANATASGAIAALMLTAPTGSAVGTQQQDATATGSIAPITLTAPTGRASIATVEGLVYQLLSNRQELDPVAGMFRVYDDDDVTVLFEAAAWANTEATIPYTGKVLRRIDRLRPP